MAKKRNAWELRLGDQESDCLTNLRFADNVLLFSTSLAQLQKMICDFKKNTENVGLKIHPDKTRILSNQSTNKRKKWRSATLKLRYHLRGRVRNILCKKIAFQQQETAEIKNRIRAAWASFNRYKEELTSKSFFVQHRLRQFDVVITSTQNYASGTWTLSKEHERMIRSKRKRRPARTRKMEKGKKQTTVTQMMQLPRVAVQNIDCDQDSDVSFVKDSDEEIDTVEIEEEE